MYSYDQWKFVFELYYKGYTLGELADWLGVHKESIRRAFCRNCFRIPTHAEKEPLDSYRDYFNSLA